MPRKALDVNKVKDDLLLYLQNSGPATPKKLCEHLRISQATVSRILSQLQNKIFKFKKQRDFLYCLPRINSNIEAVIPIFEIQLNGKVKNFGKLYPIMPVGYIFEDAQGIISAFPDLPYFLQDLRPTGFLGRLIPKIYPQFNFPAEVRLWSADSCLQYLSNCSFDNIGNLLLGDRSFKLFLENIQNPKTAIPISNRLSKYTQYASDILSLGMGGSSAGGEQPKFLTSIKEREASVLVKFSPALSNDLGKRVADILICEHIALNTLTKYKIKAAKTELLFGKERVFLEVERFDRLKNFGRQGIISLGALDAQFCGLHENWIKVAKALVRHGVITEQIYNKIVWLETFGKLIANNDMHLFNLSFIVEQCCKIKELAPVYDMTSMLFMPRNNQIVTLSFIPELPNADTTEVWLEVLEAALVFWEEVINHKKISSDFLTIAKNCKKSLLKLNKISRFL